jgi:hypothetical protein
MKIKMCGFIPTTLGTSLRMCDLPKDLVNQRSFDSDVRNISGFWLKEPYPSTVFCGADDRDFGNIKGSNRLYAFNERSIDLSKIGRFLSMYGTKSQLFIKLCDLSRRVFVQTSSEPLSVWEMDKSPKIPYHGGRFPSLVIEKKYGYLHTQTPKRSDAEQKPDSIRDITADYSTIEVETSAGYPYLEPFSPNIDFNFTINMYRRTNDYEVEIIGSHNEFPCYELFINDTSVYKYRTKWHGPNPIIY